MTEPREEPHCPKCGATMVRRRRGSACRGTREAVAVPGSGVHVTTTAEALINPVRVMVIAQPFADAQTSVTSTEY
jgi:uncharacterized OB-fold protein